MPVFPVTPILDTFNRADGALSGGGNWTTPASLSTETDLMIVSNQVLGSNGATVSSAYWNASTFSTNQGVEAYYDVVALGPINDRCELALCIQNPGTGSANNYRISTHRTSDAWVMWRTDNTVSTQIGSGTQVISTGDGIGFRNLSGTLEFWYRTGGVWSRLAAVVDTAYTTGYIGVLLSRAVSTIDNFGGGSVPPQIPLLARYP